MDVSRIEAYNPNKINWRNMTAKEILKYEKEGVHVPDVYMQWAHDFLDNIQKYDNDEITYENAKAITRHQSNEAKTNENTRGNENTKVEDLDKPDGSEDKESEEVQSVAVENANITAVNPDSESAPTENGTEAIQMTAAQLKRKDFQDKGVNLREQAVSFSQDSQTSGSAAEAQANTVREIQSNSDNEIAELEGTMRQLIAEADAKQQELKNQVNIINREKSDHSTFAKIDKLQKELEQLGMNGHNEISQGEGILRGYSGQIAAGQEVMLSAADFGTETVDVGNELLSTSGGAWWFNIDRMIGENAVKAGDNAITKALAGEDAVRSADSANNANIGKVPELRNSISDKSGVRVQNAVTEGNASEQDPITGKEKEADKDVKTAQNDGTDTTDKLHLSIDELVKRKVRRGEYAKDA